MPKSVSFDRAQVIDQVTKLFWRNGFHATSMQDLVDATGLNRSSIYNTFGDKYQLFEASIRHYQNGQSETVLQSFYKSLSPLESIHDFFLSILASIKEDKERRGCFLSNCTTELGKSDVNIQGLLIANKDAMVGLFEQKLVAAQNAGEIALDKNVRLSALYLFTSLQGLQVTAILMSDQRDLDALVERILENL
ncbi:TetR/AcrR family transcriptional regulator [Reichenbachiella agariperforans]|uniref:TetR/AcrR family transcriptional regulator n=1 Tax=Reichenbachiella agariperforans TaxID=156994 RepID=UPI001C08B15E|nr:TetR/AcrR family transcriptional regulator [Reichenbachiella agariperforans]MBU2915411.1 TetR/AcrR family transcriptional regulator [Reichenbachiella agariperforans]